MFGSEQRFRGEKEMNINDKIIAVTGATGLQGGTVARKLLADGWKVRALTARCRQACREGPCIPRC